MFSRLSPITILCATAIVAVGELAVGTRPEFVLAVIVIFVCSGVTFNMLDGFTSLAGILFSEFALRTIVFSQFVKVAVFERADKNLEAPYVTITLYAIFYACVTVSVFLFSRFRFPVPRPFEPVNKSHARKLYIVALIGGTIATVAWDINVLNPVEVHNTAKTLANVFSGLLLFAVVLAVEQRIRKTSGQHSLGWDAILPILLLQASAAIGTSRAGFLAPVLVYFVCAFTLGYRFRKRHFISAAAIAMLFYFVVSPLFLYNRGETGDEYFADRVQTTLRTFAETRGRTSLTAARVYEGDNSNRLAYYDKVNNDIVARLGLVRPDSDLIGACAGGYRYGWSTVRNDLLYALPKLIYPNKPATNSYGITGHVSGLNNEWQINAYTTVTGISDAYAGFGVLGVVLFGLFVFPLFLVVCRNAFDITKPWGIVALGLTAPNFGEWLFGQTIVNTVELPLMLFGISWLLGTFALLVPTRADNFSKPAHAVGATDETSAVAPIP